MDLTNWLNDERLLANLIGIHLVLGVLLIVSIVLRQLLKNGGDQIVRWTGFLWLDGVGKEAVKGLRAMLFWTTVVLMIVSVGSMAAYHISGRDAGRFLGVDGELTVHLFPLLVLGKIALLAVGVARHFGNAPTERFMK